MRTTVDVPDELMRRVKGVAAMRGVKLKELFTQLIELGLVSYGSPQAQPRRPLPTFECMEGRSINLLSNEEIEEILAEEDARSA